jgi:hypothetical protein
MKPLLLFSILVIFLVAGPTKAASFEVQKSALFVFLHEVKPIEEEATKALKENDYALALRKYREALKGYERIWQEYPNLPQERPRGIDRMVDDSMDACKKIIEEIKEQGEAQDEFYQKLNQLIRIDFEEKDVRSVAKMLTFLTDVNIIVDDTVFAEPDGALKPNISLRVDEAVPLRKVIVRICELTGLAYAVECDHVFLTTRVKLDSQK